VEDACAGDLYQWDGMDRYEVARPTGECSEALSDGLGTTPGDWPVLEAAVLVP